MQKLSTLSEGELINREDTSLNLVKNIILEKFRTKKVRIYEAGGGHLPRFAKVFDQCDVTIVDLDRNHIDKLPSNINFISDDICSYCPKDDKYDLIVCYFVLEHIQHPNKALENFVRLLDKDGLLFIACPHSKSLTCKVSKHTPFFFHRYFYKFVYKSKYAGEMGYPPFRAYYSKDIDFDALKEFMLSKGLSPVYEQLITSNHILKVIKHSRILSRLVIFSAKTLGLMFNNDEMIKGDYHIVFQKKSLGSEAAREPSIAG